MQEVLDLLGPGAWIIVVAAGYFTQVLVNVWKMTGVKSNYVPLTAILTGIIVVGLFQTIQGLTLNSQGIAVVLLQGILAGLGAIGLTEVHKKGEEIKKTNGTATSGPVLSRSPGLNPFLSAEDYKAILDGLVASAMPGGRLSPFAPVVKSPEPPPVPPTVEVNVAVPPSEPPTETPGS